MALAFWLERQRYDRVIEEGMRLLASAPEDPDLHRLLAVAWWMTGDSAAAKRHLREALSLAPDDQHSHELLALIESSSVGSRRSDQHAIRALALDPDSLSAWNALAVSSLVNDPPLSRRCAVRMLEIEPANIEARILLSRLCRADDGRPARAEAERWLTQALAIEPDHPNTHAELGELLLPDSRRRKQGEFHLRQALLSDPASRMAPHWKGLLVRHRDFCLWLLLLPRKFCTGTISLMVRSLQRVPLLLLLGKFYLIAVALCLCGLVVWAIMLGPAYWLYLKYVVHGEELRTRISGGPGRRFKWVVPASPWCRRLVVLAFLPTWWSFARWLLAVLGRTHPSLNGGNLMLAAVSLVAIAGAGLLLWMYIRQRWRKKELGGFAGLH